MEGTLSCWGTQTEEEQSLMWHSPNHPLPSIEIHNIFVFVLLLFLFFCFFLWGCNNREGVEGVEHKSLLEGGRLEERRRKNKEMRGRFVLLLTPRSKSERDWGGWKTGGLAHVEQSQPLVDQEESKTDSHTDTAGKMRRHQGPHLSPGYVCSYYTLTYRSIYAFSHQWLLHFYKQSTDTLETQLCVCWSFGLMTTHTDKTPYLSSYTCSKGKRMRRRGYVHVLVWSCFLTRLKAQAYSCATASCLSNACKYCSV